MKLEIDVGTTHFGTVTAKTEYGVFVAIKGLKPTGLLHLSQLRGNSQDLQLARLQSLKVGSELFVEVLKVGKKNGLIRISFSEKSIHDDVVLNDLPLNEEIIGTVIRKSEYGIFVELPDWGVSGLLHVSRMLGRNKAAQQADMASMKAGDNVAIYVQSVERTKNDLKLTLSRNRIDPDKALIESEYSHENEDEAAV